MEKRVACVAGDYARPALDKRRLVSYGRIGRENPRTARGTGAGRIDDSIGGPRWDRTSDTLIKSQVLYH